MSNSSLKDNIYSYLAAQAGLTSLIGTTGRTGWGQMPDTAVSVIHIVYSMLTEIRQDDSYLRNQMYRFWICVPQGTSDGKEVTLSIANKLLDLLHEVRGTFGSVNLQFSHNVSNQDPFFDERSNSWIIIQDYKLKIRSLEV